MSEARFGAIEAGGTKFICAIASETGQVLARERIATTDPTTTLDDVRSFFERETTLLGPVSAAGIASFGPIDLDPQSKTYGAITTTPKSGWSGVDMLGRVRSMLSVETVIHTDVTCAALAEGLYGAARGLDSYCYITVGTGIGVGVIVDGKPLGGHGHAEIGHTRISRPRIDADFRGICPFHGDCVEGIACGPAMTARWGAKPESLPDEHPAWALEAEYVATLCANLVYTVRPERIVIGGGVFERSLLYPLVRAALSRSLANYALSNWDRNLDTFVVPPGSPGEASGLLGAIELARRLHCGEISAHRSGIYV